MWQHLLPALALVLVIEGILPFLSPRTWREAMLQAGQMPDTALRVMGLLSMIAGVVILNFVT